MIDAASVGHQHQIMPGLLARQGLFGELVIAVLQPVFARHGLAQDEVRGLPGTQFGAADQVGIVQPKGTQALAYPCGGLAARDGDAGCIVQAGAWRAVAALGMADHHDDGAFGPVLQQAAVTQLLFVAQVHDMGPRCQPGAQRRHHHAQAKGGTEGVAG